MAKAAVQRPRQLASSGTLVLCCAFFWAAPGPARGASQLQAELPENSTNETAANTTNTTEIVANGTGTNGSVVAASSEANTSTTTTKTTNATSTTSTTSTTNGTATTTTTTTNTTTTTTATTNTTSTTTTTTTTNTTTTTTTTRTTNTTTTNTTTTTQTMTTTNTSNHTDNVTESGGATNNPVASGSTSQTTTMMDVDSSNMNNMTVRNITTSTTTSTTKLNLTSTTTSGTTGTTTTTTATTTTVNTTKAPTVTRPASKLDLCSAEVLDALNQGLAREVERYAIIGINLDCSHYDGEYALHRALRLKRNDIALTIISTLPRDSIQLHEDSREEITPLQMATENRMVEGVRILLEKGADAALDDPQGRTALHLGATHLGITTLLLTLSGVDNTTLLSKYDNDRDQPLHVALRGLAPESAILMVEAAEGESNAYAKYLVQVVNGDGDYPIHLCSRGDLFRLLVKYEASLQVLNREGAMPLHTASRWPGTSADGTLALLAGNVSVNTPDNYGRTPLHYAAETGNLDNVLWLIDHGAQIFVRDRNGEVPLVYALRERHVELTPTLAGDMSPLHTVVALGYYDYLTDMVINQSFPVEALDQDNRSALFMAVESGRMDITDFLVAMGADVDRRDNHGLTVLAAGIAASQEETSMYIIDRGADIFQRIQNFSTHLHVAARVANEFLVAELMQLGADVNTMDFRGFTPLHFSGSAIVAEAMLHRGAKTFESFRDRLVPIHTAVLHGHLEVLRALMVWRSSGVDTAAKNGMTSLHMAVIAQRADLVAELLKWCASTIVENKEGKDPIQYAHDAEIIRLLRDAELATDRCQCDCPAYAPGPMYITSDWNGSCHGIIRCRLQSDAQRDEVYCAAIGMPPIFSSLQNNFTGAWTNQQPNLRCPTGSVSSAWGRQGVTAALRAAVLLFSVSSLITSSF